MDKKTKTVAIIVAHPDDETLWAGGTILSNPEWQYFIVSLCRKNDADRAPKFEKAIKVFGAAGTMGNLNDGPGQEPLTENEVQAAILKLLPSRHFDLVVTHSINGEYTRHRRHEEIGTAVIKLWHAGELTINELWAFAYQDGHGAYYSVVAEDAMLFYALPQDLWEKKYSIITDIYGFDQNSWEAKTTPKEEAFWQFYKADLAFEWLVNGNITS